MSSFVLKIIGIITMLIDHIGYVFYDHSILRVIGRIAFPIFAFQSVIGYEHTSNKKKHLLKLFLFGVISQIPFYLMNNAVKQFASLNIMFTILLGLISISIFNKFSNRFDGLLAVFFICFLGIILRVDYGWFGVLLIFLFNYFKDNKIKMVLATCILFVLHYAMKIVYLDALYYLKLLFSSFLSLVPICLYNKKEGIKTKYLFYVFYPLHMLLLWLIFIII